MLASILILIIVVNQLTQRFLINWNGWNKVQDLALVQGEGGNFIQHTAWFIVGGINE